MTAEEIAGMRRFAHDILAGAKPMSTAFSAGKSLLALLDIVERLQADKIALQHELAEALATIASSYSTDAAEMEPEYHLRKMERSDGN